jgi:hypothetical protein
MDKIAYAIIDSNNNLDKINDFIKGIRGIAGSNLYTITFKDVSVVVSYFTHAKYFLSKELAIDFARVVEELSQQLTLLPIRFGIYSKSDENINLLLYDNYNSFRDNLTKIENKFEFGLKVIWDFKKGNKKIKEKVESEVLKVDDYFSQRTIHTNYLFEKIKKHRLEDALLKHEEQLIKEIGLYLAEINPDCKFKKMLSQSIILDAVFLVKKAKKVEFIEAIEALKQQHGDLHFLLTGPWPPYSFVEIIIDK